MVNGIFSPQPFQLETPQVKTQPLLQPALGALKNKQESALTLKKLLKKCPDAFKKIIFEPSVISRLPFVCKCFYVLVDHPNKTFLKINLVKNISSLILKTKPGLEKVKFYLKLAGRMAPIHASFSKGLLELALLNAKKIAKVNERACALFKIAALNNCSCQVNPLKVGAFICRDVHSIHDFELLLKVWKCEHQFKLPGFRRTQRALKNYVVRCVQASPSCLVGFWIEKINMGLPYSDKDLNKVLTAIKVSLQTHQYTHLACSQAKRKDDRYLQTLQACENKLEVLRGIHCVMRETGIQVPQDFLKELLKSVSPLVNLMGAYDKILLVHLQFLCDQKELAAITLESVIIEIIKSENFHLLKQILTEQYCCNKAAFEATLSTLKKMAYQTGDLKEKLVLKYNIFIDLAGFPSEDPRHLPQMLTFLVSRSRDVCSPSLLLKVYDLL